MDKITLDVNPTDSIKSIRKKIKIHTGIPINQQHLIFNGKKIHKGNISSVGITKDSIIHMVPRKVMIS